MDIVKKRKELWDESQNSLKYWSERRDLNARPLPPQGSALAKLSYAPTNRSYSTHFQL